MNNYKDSSNKMLTQADLFDRGWTLGLIDKFLPEPHWMHNGHRGRPTKLWFSEMVLCIENTEAFKTEKQKADHHSYARNAVVREKKEAMLSDFENIIESITIPVIDDDTLREWVLDNMERHIYKKGYTDFGFYTPREDTMQRWIVNYIRHNFVRYDISLLRKKGQVGITISYPYFKRRVLEKIAEAYPRYAAECLRQAG